MRLRGRRPHLVGLQLVCDDLLHVRLGLRHGFDHPLEVVLHEVRHLPLRGEERLRTAASEFSIASFLELTTGLTYFSLAALAEHR